MTDRIPAASDPVDKPAADAGLSRRRLVRAGLAAAPVLAALKSNSVLAGGGAGGNCIRPSTFSSMALNAARGSMSRNPRADAHGVCKTPSDWRGALPQGYSQVMFLAHGKLPDDDKPGRDKDDKKGGGNSGNGNGNGNLGASPIKTPFTKDPGQKLGNRPYHQLTLDDVLASNAGDDTAKLARYVTAAYLSHKTGDGWLTEGEIRAIWEGQGRWTTGSQELWDMKKTLAFFEAVYYPSPISSL